MACPAMSQAFRQPTTWNYPEILQDSQFLEPKDQVH